MPAPSTKTTTSVARRSSGAWFAIDVTLETGAAEAVQYALMEAGAVGTETSESNNDLLRVSAYFSEAPQPERVETELLEALRIYGLPSTAVRGMNVREVEDQDWVGQWKQSWQPVFVAERFVIAPPWSEVADTADRLLIRIEPGMAFGTGTHETTRLCLAAMEKYFVGGSFLDVGTGTGILAIAAARLFSDARIEACDTDPEAITIARENALLNRVSDHVVFRVGTIEDTTRSADLVCANLTANAIARLLPRLRASTCGRLILSGILESQIDLILMQLRECDGVEPCEVNVEGEWAAIVV